MKNLTRKMFIIILVLSIIISNNTIIFAVTDIEQSDVKNLKVIEFNGVRIATASDEKTEYTTVYNTINNTIQVFAKDISTNKISSGTLMSTDTNKILSDLTSTRSTIHQDTFSNFEYDIWTGEENEWNLERPSGAFSQYYFMVNENDSNDEELDEWYSAVNNLNDKEWEAVATCSLALVKTAAAGFISGMAASSSGILSVAAIKSIVEATEAAGDGVVALERVGACCNDCLLTYMDVYDSTDNMHF